VNVLLRLDPTLDTATMIATEMTAAIKPYSMAVAPLSSWKTSEEEESWRALSRMCPHATYFLPIAIC
jgi:hypothetical protein